MARWWVAGEEAAEECLRMFFHSKLADGVFDQPPFNSDPASNKSSDSAAAGTKQTRIATYNDTRNRADLPGTSRLSPYLAAGIISPRRCLRKALEAQKEGKGRKSDTLETDRGSGIGMWVGEMVRPLSFSFPPCSTAKKRSLMPERRTGVPRVLPTRPRRLAEGVYGPGVPDEVRQGRVGVRRRHVQSVDFRSDRGASAPSLLILPLLHGKKQVLRSRHSSRWSMRP